MLNYSTYSTEQVSDTPLGRVGVVCEVETLCIHDPDHAADFGRGICRRSGLLGEHAQTDIVPSSVTDSSQRMFVSYITMVRTSGDLWVSSRTCTASSLC